MATYKRNRQLLDCVILAIIILATFHRKALAQPRPETVIHIVAWGETISSIAAQYGVGIDDIVAVNHLAEPDRIFAGQRLVIPVASVSTLSGSERSEIHIVQPGETLYRISLKYGMSVQAFMGANALQNADRVYIGQALIVPRESTNKRVTNDETVTSKASTHVVRYGETLFGIGQQYGVSTNSLQTANNLLNPSQLFVGQRLTIPGAAGTSASGYTPEQAVVTYVVQAGENLSTIAARYGVSMWVIAQSNSIGNTSLIYPGQMLSIPSSGSLSSSGVPAANIGRSIVVDISEQRTYVYDDGIVLQVFVVSTGLPGQDTRRGNFRVQNKIPIAYAATWDLQMPYWLGFYWAGSLQNGFHALPILSNGVRLWEALLGAPASYGCVILSENDAKWLYEWASVGTPVTVRD